LVTLCLTYFTDSRTGAIREYFDDRWQPLAEAGRIVEPGHQFEWAWLLLKWGDLPQIDESQRIASRRAANSLVDIGERWGIDPTRGVAINEIWDDMARKDPAAKLWPQTERIKAWCATLARSPTAVEVERAAISGNTNTRTLARSLVGERRISRGSQQGQQLLPYRVRHRGADANHSWR
jgi:mannose/cellobiose epimerase-like protein (N-acyl-D-glucosamine 2-epimerase family)